MNDQDLMDGVRQPAEASQDAQDMAPGWDLDLIWDEGGWPVGRVERRHPQLATNAPR